MLDELRNLSPMYHLDHDVSVSRDDVAKRVRENVSSSETAIIMRRVDGMLKSDIPEIRHAAEVFVESITDPDGIDLSVDTRLNSGCYFETDSSGRNKQKMVLGKSFLGNGDLPYQYKFVHEVKHLEDAKNGIDLREPESEVLSETHALAAELATYVQVIAKFPNAIIPEYEQILDLSRKQNINIARVVETFGLVHAENPDYRFVNIMQDVKLKLGLL